MQAQQAKSAHLYEKDQVFQIIQSVLKKVEHSDDQGAEAIFSELRELQSIIEETRKTIGSLNSKDIHDKHIPTATDELDAVVDSTAEATGVIMDCCEEIEALADDNAAVQAAIMKIYEACSFQDLTGQRITKVVSTLKKIEDKVRRLLSLVPQGAHAGSAALEASVVEVLEDEEEGDGLLNGPQLPGHGVTQDDIDAILAQFD